eukprot:GEMP01032841.1.p1 GENE.GEMP01032841.1~~GEMP01032841.1.p1  ORF type:complete len:357 (+),score=87.12 GEMP01032841.1:168-1238(+)
MLATNSLRPTSLRIRNTFLEVTEVSNTSTPTNSPRPAPPSTTPAAFAPQEVFASTVFTRAEGESPIASPSPLRCPKRKQPEPVKYVAHTSMKSIPELPEDAKNDDACANQAIRLEQVSSPKNSPVPMIGATPTPVSGEIAQKIKLVDFIMTPASAVRSINMPENAVQQQLYFHNMNMNQFMMQQQQYELQMYAEPCAKQPFFELDGEHVQVYQRGDYDDMSVASPGWETYCDPATLLLDPLPATLPCSPPPIVASPAPDYLPPVVTPQAATSPPLIAAATCLSAVPALKQEPLPYSTLQAPPAAPAPEEIYGDTRALLLAVLESNNPLGVQVVIDHARNAGLTPQDVRLMLGGIHG